MATNRRSHRISQYLLDPIPDSLWRGPDRISDLKLGHCETCGFIHVDPYPSDEYLMNYYQTYEMPTQQANLREIAQFLSRNVPKDARVLDVGCGDGSFLKELHQLGFARLAGFDQGPGIERALQQSFAVFQRGSLRNFLDDAERSGGVEADAVVLIHVLEHVPDPLGLLARLQRVLHPGALLCVQVPNDFSPLQKAFLKVTGHRPWFVCLPDHLNYFNFETLSNALSRNGFERADQTALYPLELFLLQDLDYIAHPELGRVANQRRVQFETNLKNAGMEQTLHHFYRTLAAGGYGRALLLAARKSGEAHGRD